MTYEENIELIQNEWRLTQSNPRLAIPVQYLIGEFSVHKAILPCDKKRLAKTIADLKEFENIELKEYFLKILQEIARRINLENKDIAEEV